MDIQSGASAQKVPLYSINDLKNATDDAVAPYLTSLPAPYTFRLSHYHTDVRLATGYSAVAIAAATFYFDWKLGWEATKYYTAGGCLLYFILNGFLTLWIWKFEAGKVFVGAREGRQKLTLQSSVKKHVPVYRLKVLYVAPSGKVWEDKEIEGRFAQWFSEDGYLRPEEFKRWLACSIEVVGMADPKAKGTIEEQSSSGRNDSDINHSQNLAAEAPNSATSARKVRRKA